MARKTKASPQRRLAQKRPPTGSTRPAAAADDLEQRLAALDAEREQLLAQARAADGGDTAAEAAIPLAAAAAGRPAPSGRRAPLVAPGTPRRVGRVTPGPATGAMARPRAGIGRAAAAAVDALDPDDAAIPLERVPYVGADLRRVAVIAGLMVLLIVIADIVVRIVVK